MTPAVQYTLDDVISLPELWQGDVAVIGGGSAGASAATAAARTGARTFLVESGGFLGGTGARVLDTFYGFYAPGPGSNRMVGGIGWEVCDRLLRVGQAFERPNTYGAGTGVTYEPEALKVVWDSLVADSGADLLLYGLLSAAVVDGGAVIAIVVETRGGPQLVRAKTFVDASGDAELAWRAGASFNTSLELRQSQPATATFRVGGVKDKPASTAELHAALEHASASSTYQLPRLEGSIHATVLPGVRHANMTRTAGLDLTDPWELTLAERDGRRQVQEYVRFLKNEVPGYEDCYLISTSSRIGIRETRRVNGRYVLTRDDVLGAVEHADGIARCGAPVEDHAAGGRTKWEYVGGGADATGESYTIPYRCLLPTDLEGVLLAGRCLSATHDAHASVRSMAQCMAMGQAAGVASAMSASRGIWPSELDVDAVRKQLTAEGAVL